MPAAESALVPRASTRLLRSCALSDEVGRLKYVSGAREEALRRLGIETVGDLLLHIPRRYLDFSRAFTIEEAPLGSVCTIVGTVDRVANKPTRNRRLTVTEVALVDETGVLKVAFFKQPWLVRELAQGDRLAVMGTVEFNYGFKQMSGPHYEKLDAADAAGSILPVHPVTEGLSQAWMRRIVSGALEATGQVADPLPARLRAKRRLMGIGRAQRAIHFPRALYEVEQARRRLAYDELLYLQLGLRLRAGDNVLGVTPFAHRVGAHVEALRAALPFALSEEQEAAVADVLGDMADGTRVMNRLLMGDVGTGKTAVACFGLASAADTGTQACMMAPTSVLAQQYAATTGPLLERAGLSWALLTGSTPAPERAEILSRLEAGALDVLFGTHALLGDDVRFRCLSLVVIDEQHRFGVDQRASLREKGPGADLLVMSATPIPRTLALSLYGDLDTSVIRTRPVAGAGVTTRVLEAPNRDLAYGAVRRALEAGRQAYVICPLVSEQDGTDGLEDVPGIERDDEGRERPAGALHAVETEAERLAQVFPGAVVGALHGRMRPREKEAAIEAFRSGATQLLVSTTVVEVGVDVPNATVMLIENGERFGLATLHQLRGRVGRGGVAGECYVITEAARRGGAPSPALERLEALASTEDGFELAALDLRLRHEGEILGLRQSGGVTLRFVDLDSDADLVEAAHGDAEEILRYAPGLDAVATLPLKHEVVERYGTIFKEVGGG